MEVGGWVARAEFRPCEVKRRPCSRYLWVGCGTYHFIVDRRQVDLPLDSGTEWACGRPGGRREKGGRDVAGVLRTVQ